MTISMIFIFRENTNIGSKVARHSLRDVRSSCLEVQNTKSHQRSRRKAKKGNGSRSRLLDMSDRVLSELSNSECEAGSCEV